MSGSGSGGVHDAAWRAWRLTLALAACVVPAVAGGCGGDAPAPWVDTPAVAEMLRAGADEISGICAEGFPGFLHGVDALLAARPGTDRERAALAGALRPGRHLDPATAARPDLLRLMLHRYASVCRAGAAAERVERFTEMLEEHGDDRGALIESLEDVLEGLALEGARITLPDPDGDAQAVVIRLPETRPAAPGGDGGPEGDGGAPGEDAPPVVLLACLRCRSGLEVSGARQAAAATTALEALAASALVRRRPVELVLCLDASRKPGQCAEGVLDRSRPVAAAVALDGAERLGVAWSAEASWHLALPHAPPAEAWLATTRRRVARSPNARTRPILVDLGAPGTLEALPAEAWMDLIDVARPAAELRDAIERDLRALGLEREDARYEVSIEGQRVRVTARADSIPAWEITERRNALWDLAAAALWLHVVDSPRGGGAAMLRAVARFDGDPYGARLGMHYEDPLVGPLLVAPCTLSTRGGRVILGLRLYRPPGLPRDAFLARLDDALARLRLATGRELTEADREVGEPSRVTPGDERITLVRRALVEVEDRADLPEPTGSPRPGLSALLPDAISVRLPTGPSTLTDDPATALVVELLWQLAVATDPEVRRRAAWD